MHALLSLVDCRGVGEAGRRLRQAVVAWRPMGRLSGRCACLSAKGDDNDRRERDRKPNTLGDCHSELPIIGGRLMG
jgi:hypothetical protein